MTPVMQEKISRTDGDCLRACVASLLDMEMKNIPDFVNDFPEWFDAMWYWLRFQGYNMLFYDANKIDDKQFNSVLNNSELNENKYVIVQVDSTFPECTHVCIYSLQDKRIVHDPEPGHPCIKIQPPITGYYSIWKPLS